MAYFDKKRRLLLTLIAFFAGLVFVCGCQTESVFLPSPTASYTAEPTPSPTTSPTPTPAPILSLSDCTLPETDARLPLGSDFPLAGTVTCNYPLSAVILSDVCQRSEDPLYPCEAAVTFPHGGPNVYSLADDTAVLEGASLDTLFDFSALTPGVHTLTLCAVCSCCDELHELHKVTFYVLSDKWERIRKSDFGDGYNAALSFFGKPERFCYRYQWVYGRYTVADPDWEDAYIVSLDGVGSRPWLVHRDAVPYYEKAFSYMKSALVRVHGTNGDTGVLPLSELVYTNNGSYVSRFTSSLKTISHHAFGTASDVNAKLSPNLNNKENKALIDNEVKDKLVYNGILTENGVSWYDFAYSGSAALTENGVPETVVNYLLYELAFYRAGFLWGHYYASTSDAMHFTLSESTRHRHEDMKGLQKVTEYFD